MKKNYRGIFIDEEHWAWTFYTKGCFDEDQYVKIWNSDKKLVFNKRFYLNLDFEWSLENRNKKYDITSELIFRFIKIYLKNEKYTLDSTK